MTVRRRDPGRGGESDVEAEAPRVVAVTVDGVGLAAAGLAGEEDRCAGLQQCERLVLGHAFWGRF